MSSDLPARWYVLCYHDVRWAEPRHIRGLGICHPVDVFTEQLDALSEHGELISHAEGMARTASGDLDHPTFSLSFDDGYRGVIDHVAPLLGDAGITALAAINPAFVDDRGTFWRAQLCWIREAGLLDVLVDRLDGSGFRGGSVRDHTMDRCDPSIIDTISALYSEAGSAEARRRDRAQLTMTVEQVRGLEAAGWEIANHSATHLPLLEESCRDQIEDEYAAAEAELATMLGHPTSTWVAPFDRPTHRSARAVASLRNAAAGRTVALVGDRATRPQDIADGVLYRVFPPVAGPTQLLDRLRSAARRADEPAPHEAAPS